MVGHCRALVVSDAGRTEVDDFEITRNFWKWPVCSSFAIENVRQNTLSQLLPPDASAPSFTEAWPLVTAHATKDNALNRTNTPHTKKSDHAEQLIRGPTLQRCGELLAEETTSSQGGLQPQNSAQRPLHRRRQFGIRGHGYDNMDLRTCANTGLHASFCQRHTRLEQRPEMQM